MSEQWRYRHDPQTRVVVELAADICSANKGASDPLRLQVTMGLVEALLRREIARLDAVESEHEEDL